MTFKLLINLLKLPLHLRIRLLSFFLFLFQLLADTSSALGNKFFELFHSISYFDKLFLQTFVVAFRDVSSTIENLVYSIELIRGR